MKTTPWSAVQHKATERQLRQARATQRRLEAARAPTAQHPGPSRGDPRTLLVARATQQMLNIVREEFDTALLQARRDGWSLRALADATGLSYNSIKRYSQRAVDRGH